MSSNSTVEQTSSGPNSLASSAVAAAQHAPAALSQAAARVEALTRRGVERARELGTGVREQASRAGERTVGYIKDEPMKAVLIAAATGAVVALVASALTRRRDD